eukprot:CAMPEP_0196165380 /NCGR_PEP_ID=MMETSP0911-20130528/1295_1 /TAXON_ID=49265 /ORGANISM="Thalassiosira rotula, Strain GSO102" /LENGTH=69 /DNA_ID=CAMNT_0041430819 /DNA_START=1169 /DNA_END=1377 /DNA_ORIENTATION=+
MAADIIARLGPTTTAEPAIGFLGSGTETTAAISAPMATTEKMTWKVSHSTKNLLVLLDDDDDDDDDGDY